MSEARKDYISSLIFFLIGIGVVVSTRFIKDPGLSDMGPREFPVFIGICMVALSLVLFMKTVRISKGEVKSTGGADAKPDTVRKDELRAFAVALICLLYAAAFTVLGFFLSTFLAVTLICLVFREKRIWVYPLLYFVAAVIWMGFSWLLSIRLP